MQAGARKVPVGRMVRALLGERHSYYLTPRVLIERDPSHGIEEIIVRDPETREWFYWDSRYTFEGEDDPPKVWMFRVGPWLRLLLSTVPAQFR